MPKQNLSVAKVKIDSLFTVKIPAVSKLLRETPRAVEDQQPDYLDNFDSQTLFYDVFFDGSKLVAVGPPLANLSTALDAEVLFGRAKSILARRDFGKALRASATKPMVSFSKNVAIDFDGNNIELQPSTADHSLFSGLNVIQTMSKNTPLEWVKQWATFYCSTQDVDGIIFYDNNSTDYSINELASVFESIPGLKAAVVVPYNFKYGPLGFSKVGPKKWDSDYCQISSFEHARQKFLQKARAWLNVDIDELVVSKSGSVFDQAVAAEGTGILIDGTWMSAFGVSSDRSIYDKYPYRNLELPSCTRKWCVVPSRIPEYGWMTVHSSRKAGVLLESKDAQFRHFIAVTIRPRFKTPSKAPAEESRCSLLESSLNAAFSS
jgi:hypothetical protein